MQNKIGSKIYRICPAAKIRATRAAFALICFAFVTLAVLFSMPSALSPVGRPLTVYGHVFYSNGTKVNESVSYNISVFYAGANSTLYNSTKGISPGQDVNQSFYDYVEYNSTGGGDLIVLRLNKSANGYQDVIWYHIVTSSEENLQIVTVPNLTMNNPPPARVSGLAASKISAQTKLNVSWTANTDVDFVRYKLYRKTSNFSNITSGTNIINFSANTTVNYVDNDTNLASETNYFYGIAAVDNEGNENASITTSNATVADTVVPAPVSNLTSSVSGQTITLSWDFVQSNTDGTAANDIQGYMVYASNGTSGNSTTPPGVPSDWVNIVNVSNSTKTYAHSSLPTGYTFYYQVFGYDEIPNVSPNSTTANGSITSVTVSTSLLAGWNLFSVPVQASSMSTSSLMTNLNWSSVWWYNYSSSSWKNRVNVDGSEAGPLTALELGRGYWVYLNHAVTWNVTGTYVAQNITVPTGWIMIGFSSSQSSASVSTVLGNLDWSSIWWYNTTSSSWKNRVNIDGSQAGPLTTLYPGLGYWLYSNQNSTIAYT